MATLQSSPASKAPDKSNSSPRTAQQSPAAMEDATLSRVLQVTLTYPENNAGLPVYMEQLAAEMLSEGHELLLARGDLERVLMDRLSMPQETLPKDAQDTPLKYLVECYRRALDEARRVGASRNKELVARLQDTLATAKDLLVSYTGLMLQHPDMFPQPKTVRHPLSLLDLIVPPSEVSPLGFPSSGGASGLPPGFLDQLVQRFESEGLEEIFTPVFTELPGRLVNVSPLGPFQGPLKALATLVAYPGVAKVLVAHPKWLPRVPNGRMLELGSILGPFLRLSIFPDVYSGGKPDVVQQCFDGDMLEVNPKRQQELHASQVSLRALLAQLHEGLHEVFLALLRKPDMRERALAFVAGAIAANEARGKMQSDAQATASDGFFHNLGAVLLKLCGPFLDPASGKKERIDAGYVLHNARVSFKDLTALAASSEEVALWAEKRNEGASASQQEQEEQRRLSAHGATSSAPAQNTGNPASRRASGSTPPSPGGGGQGYHFICECFFLTARALNLGLGRILSNYDHFSREVGRMMSTYKRLLAAKEAGTLSPQEAARLEQYKKALNRGCQMQLLFETALSDVTFIQSAMSYYRLMAMWLADQAGGLRVPLPVPPPMDFASMPEHFVEDMDDLLLYVVRRVPKAFEGANLEDFTSFMVVFAGSSDHLKNPYLRSKFVEILAEWLPDRCPTGSIRTIMTGLFEGHPLAIESLVPNLLRLFVDIEFTGRHNAFYEKFNIRHNIANILEYLWRVPAHQAAWARFAAAEEKGFYLRFINMLANDAIYCLDSALHAIPDLKAVEEEMADAERWQAQPAETRSEREEGHQRSVQEVKWNMIQAGEHLGMLGYTSAVIVAPLLLPEMVDRIASMLNYFLLQLTGPQRKVLKVKDPEKYGFRPRELLGQIVDIYVNIARGDRNDAFASAVAADERSYREDAFPETAALLRTHMLRPEPTARAFAALGEKVRGLRSEAMDVEGALGDIPDEFLDPIMGTLMKDPVVLPSSQAVVDRAVIMRHLLTDEKDPFNRSMLTAEMLKPDTELKAKIDAFLAEHRQ